MSIKITPDKYPQIIEVYNTEGKTAAYDLMRSCYEIKNPTCVMKRMKADKSLDITMILTVLNQTAIRKMISF